MLWKKLRTKADRLAGIYLILARSELNIHLFAFEQLYVLMMLGFIFDSAAAPLRRSRLMLRTMAEGSEKGVQNVQTEPKAQWFSVL